MNRVRLFRRVLCVVAALVAGTLPTCQATLRDSFVNATKSTFLQATGDLFNTLFNPEAFGITPLDTNATTTTGGGMRP